MKMNKKGFTIVELVIVIAVIAILAGVLIPTFSGIVTRAQTSAAVQEARNMYTEYTGMHDYSNGTTPDKNVVIKVANDKYVAVAGGKIKADAVYATEAAVIAANIGITDANYTLVSKDNTGKLTAVKDTADVQGG